jgi:hypothetical protein
VESRDAVKSREERDAVELRDAAGPRRSGEPPAGTDPR